MELGSLADCVEPLRRFRDAARSLRRRFVGEFPSPALSEAGALAAANDGHGLTFEGDWDPPLQPAPTPAWRFDGPWRCRECGKESTDESDVWVNPDRPGDRDDCYCDGCYQTEKQGGRL